MLPLEKRGEVEHFLKLRSTDVGTQRDIVKDWTIEHFDYAESRVGTDISHQLPEQQKAMRAALARLRAERIEKDRQTQQMAQHAELRNRLDALAKPHWSTVPAFWVAVISAGAAIIAAYFAWLAVRK